MKNNRFVVIMAGGKGERFWPQSRLERPKHLLPIVGDAPMLTQTLRRLDGLVPVENQIIITNAEQRKLVLEVCSELPAENVIGEPIGRDTAAAVGLAALLVGRRSPDAVFAILPADHIIENTAGFQKVLNRAFVCAESESVLVTIGIKPNIPATGLGYIHKGEVSTSIDGVDVYSVQDFVEKPDLETAKSYLASGEYFWNAGMFIWGVKTVNAAFSQFVPELHNALNNITTGLDKGDAIDDVLAEEYPKLEKISIDYALMEKAKNVVTIQSEFDWDDVGEWPAIARHFPKDTSENVSRGDVVLQQSEGNIVYSSDGHLTALLGVEDLIVVHSGDATLICHKDKAQEIKGLVQEIGSNDKYKKLV